MVSYIILLYYFTILYYTTLYYTMLYYTILYYAMLCYAMLCYAMLCYTILFYAVLCCAVLYCTILYYYNNMLGSSLAVFSWSLKIAVPDLSGGSSKKHSHNFCSGLNIAGGCCLSNNFGQDS